MANLGEPVREVDYEPVEGPLATPPAEEPEQAEAPQTVPATV